MFSARLLEEEFFRQRHFEVIKLQITNVDDRLSKNSMSAMIHVIAHSTPLYIAQCIELFCCFNTIRESTQVKENYADNHKSCFIL
jgi:hypothetical protein